MPRLAGQMLEEELPKQKGNGRSVTDLFVVRND
jgi:hypothetical protein